MGTPCEHVSWPKNLQTVTTFPSACFIWFFFPHFYKKTQFCFKFQLLREQPCWFTLQRWRAEKSLLTLFLILLPNIPALFMTLRQPMVALNIVFLHLSINGVFYFIFSKLYESRYSVRKIYIKSMTKLFSSPLRHLLFFHMEIQCINMEIQCINMEIQSTNMEI